MVSKKVRGRPQTDASKQRDAQIADLRNQGLTLKEIAAQLGLSAARISQILVRITQKKEHQADQEEVVING